MRSGRKRGAFGKTEFKAGLTVEAAYVMAIVLMSVGALIRFGFRIHDEATADFVLNEGIELSGHSRDPDNLEISERGEGRMEYSMYIRDPDIRISGEGKKITGVFSSEKYTKIMTDKGFEPEKLMRMITLIEKAGDKIANGI